MYRRDVAEHEHERLREPDEDAPAPRTETPAPVSPVAQVASAVGNRAFTATLARHGEGIGPGGRVTPEVQDALDARRGQGASLDEATQARLAPSLGDLSDVRVHTDGVADGLNRAVAARAFATGSDVFFAQGEYRPGSVAGDRLLTHELAHVAQQRGASASGPLTVSQPGDELERDADRVADGLP